MKNQIYRQLFFKRVIVFTSFLMCILASSLYSQDNIVLQNLIVGNATVSAPSSITLNAGFEALAGSSFTAVIGPSQPANSSATINPSSSINSPASGTSSENYIKTITYMEAHLTEPTDSFKHGETVQYFDGLGRSIQTIAVGASPLGNDIIQPILYDELGREKYKTLPYTAAKSGNFRTGVDTTALINYYSQTTPEGIISDTKPFKRITYEKSPLSRILAQNGPGSAWSDKSIKINYLTNASSVPSWHVYINGSIGAFSYAEKYLYITETIDEDGHITREYKDRQDQIVQKESKIGTEWLRTAYIYDDFGLLRCIVPPEATSPSDTSLCYYYSYDSKKRLTSKKIPGGGTIKMVYDLRDRLRCTQNSEQAKNNEWSFTKYDVLNRPVMTGVIKNYTGDFSALNTASNMNETFSKTTNSNYGYNNVSFPTAGQTFEIHTVIWHDSYDFFYLSHLAMSDSLKSTKYDVPPYNFSTEVDTTPKGSITGTMTCILSPGDDSYLLPKTTLYTTMYYDKYGHLLRTIGENQLGGKDVVSTIYEDITYLPKQSKQEHYKGAENIILEKKFTYDHNGRLLAINQNINNQGEITLSAQKYNEVGELITNYLHSNQTSGSRTFIQKVDYKYNIRGWLTQINEPDLSSGNDLFGMQLYYNTTEGMGGLHNSTSIFNGNIVGMKWNIKNDKMRGYRFSYDDLNRMLSATYADGSSLSNNTGAFDEMISNYDRNGNILSLMRYYNGLQVDDLGYTYYSKSNQLQQIEEFGQENAEVDDYPGTGLSQNYTYDKNGNMTNDGGRDISFNYFNTLNLPNSVDFGNNSRIFYHYTATGLKLLKHSSSDFTHYIGNIVYEGNNLSYIITDQGRLITVGTGTNRKFLYEYNLKDHLGNIRVTFMGTDLAGAADVVQTNSYYPFGLTMLQNNYYGSYGFQNNKYLYNGKEIQDDNLNGKFFGMLDYGARFYDPQIGRFHSIDPMGEITFRITPYHYCLNNPLRFTDPTGMLTTDEIIRDAWNNTPAGQDRKFTYGDNQDDTQEPPGKKHPPTTLKGIADQFVDDITPGPPGPDFDEERARKDENIKNATVFVYTASVLIATNVGLFFISEGVGYVISKVGGRIVTRIVSKKVIEALEKSGSKYINLASAKSTAHILAGDATGGGHAWFASLVSFTNGLKGAKTMFPAKWSTEKIMHAVSYVTVNNNWIQQTGKLGASFTRSGQPVRYAVEGVYDGVTIRVITTATDIITAFPIK